MSSASDSRSPGKNVATTLKLSEYSPFTYVSYFFFSIAGVLSCFWLVWGPDPLANTGTTMLFGNIFSYWQLWFYEYRLSIFRPIGRTNITFCCVFRKSIWFHSPPRCRKENLGRVTVRFVFSHATPLRRYGGRRASSSVAPVRPIYWRDVSVVL